MLRTAMCTLALGVPALARGVGIDNSSNCTIVLLGDSLIHKPYTEHNLSIIMADMITLSGGPNARSLVLVDSGNNGEEVASVSPFEPVIRLAAFDHV